MKYYIFVALVLAVGLISFQVIKAQQEASITKAGNKAEITKSVTEVVDVKELDAELISLEVQKSGLENQIQGLQSRVDGLAAEIAEKTKLRNDIVQKFPELEPVKAEEVVISEPIK